MSYSDTGCSSSPLSPLMSNRVHCGNKTPRTANTCCITQTTKAASATCAARHTATRKCPGVAVKRRHNPPFNSCFAVSSIASGEPQGSTQGSTVWNHEPVVSSQQTDCYYSFFDTGGNQSANNADNVCRDMEMEGKYQPSGRAQKYPSPSGTLSLPSRAALAQKLIYAHNSNTNAVPNSILHNSFISSLSDDDSNSFAFFSSQNHVEIDDDENFSVSYRTALVDTLTCNEHSPSRRRRQRGVPTSISPAMERGTYSNSISSDFMDLPQHQEDVVVEKRFNSLAAKMEIVKSFKYPFRALSAPDFKPIPGYRCQDMGPAETLLTTIGSQVYLYDYISTSCVPLIEASSPQLLPPGVPVYAAATPVIKQLRYQGSGHFIITHSTNGGIDAAYDANQRDIIRVVDSDRDVVRTVDPGDFHTFCGNRPGSNVTVKRSFGSINAITTGEEGSGIVFIGSASHKLVQQHDLRMERSIVSIIDCSGSSGRYVVPYGGVSSGHHGICCLALDPRDSFCLAAGTGDGSIKVFDLRKATKTNLNISHVSAEVVSFDGLHCGSVTKILWNRSFRRRLYSSGEDGNLIHLSTNSGLSLAAGADSSATGIGTATLTGLVPTRVERSSGGSGGGGSLLSSRSHMLMSNGSLTADSNTLYTVQTDSPIEDMVQLPSGEIVSCHRTINVMQVRSEAMLKLCAVMKPPQSAEFLRENMSQSLGSLCLSGDGSTLCVATKERLLLFNELGSLTSFSTKHRRKENVVVISQKAENEDGVDRWR